MTPAAECTAAAAPAPAPAKTVAQDAANMIAQAAKGKMTLRKVVDPYPKSILGKRNALHAFGTREHSLQPLSKKSRSDEGNTDLLLLRHAEAEITRMQQEHTTRVTDLRDSLQDKMQETSMYIDTIQKLKKNLQHEQENASELRSELNGKQQEHTATVAGLQMSLQNKTQETSMYIGTIQMLEDSLQHEQENVTRLRGELCVSEIKLEQTHAQLTLEQNHVQGLQNELEKANQCLATERETNDRKSQENAALTHQIQMQQDRDMDDATFHGHLQTPENSELEVMDESEDSIQSQKEQSNGAEQSSSEELARLNNEVTKLSAELQHEQEMRKLAEDKEEIYRRLYHESQESLMPIQQSSDLENYETNWELEASCEGSSTAQADVAPPETIESEIDSENDQVLETKPLSRKETLSKPKNAMNSRSTKVERSKARTGKASIANGVKKSRSDKKSVKEAAEEVARKLRVVELKKEAEFKQTFRKVLENHIKLSDDLYTEAREGLKMGKSSEDVDVDIRTGLQKQFDDAGEFYDNGLWDQLSWHTLYPNDYYREFRYYTMKGGEEICIELLDVDLNWCGGYPILPSYKPYSEMDMTNKAHYAQNVIFAKIPELQLAAAEKVLSEYLVNKFRERLFEEEPPVETWEQIHCKARWDDVVSILTSMQSFQRACGYYAQGADLSSGLFWPLNFAKPEIMTACDPEWDDPPYAPSNVGTLENLFTQTFIR